MMFIVRHSHAPERCPAGDPLMGTMLLSHLSPENAARNGITIRGEAVLDGKHTLYMFMEAPNRDHIERFMTPFRGAGDLDIWHASPCERVIERGGC